MNDYDERGLIKPAAAAAGEAQRKSANFNNSPGIITDNLVNIKMNNKVNDNGGRTSFEKGYALFKSLDGREHDSIEAVRAANKAFLDKLKIDTSYKSHLRFDDVEKAYFDCITPNFDFSNLDIDGIRQNLTAQQQQAMDYIQESYDDYLSRLLEQYGLTQRNRSKDTKKL